MSDKEQLIAALEAGMVLALLAPCAWLLARLVCAIGQSLIE